MKAKIVLTTINVPILLKEYCKNLQKFGHKDVGFIVIGDRKTPHKKCQEIASEITNKGFEARYLDISQQEHWLAKFPELRNIIPYDNDNRRNIGFLIAYEEGAELITSIDDDNYASSDDFYGHHSIVGKQVRMRAVSSVNGWFNPCSLLETSNGRTIYQRGFPFSRRWKDELSFTVEEGRVVLNMGLWTGVPDADSITHLNEPVTISKMKSEPVMLLPRTFCPINTQNTTFHEAVLPCYYFVLMREKIDGMILDRYGDVWSGFFAKKVIDRMNDRVTVGRPLTEHKRNIHNLFTDLKTELQGMILTERLVDSLESWDIDSNTYPDAYLEISDKLEDLEIDPNPSVKRYFAKISHAMKIWVKVCDTLS